MKKILLVLSIFALAASGMAQNSAYKVISTSLSERFSTKILKVYEARSQEGVYIAYVVDWRGQEVIVTPQASSAPLKVGDSVECIMQSISFPSGADGGKGTLIFNLRSPAGNAQEHMEAMRNRARQLRQDARGPAGEKPAE